MDSIKNVGAADYPMTVPQSPSNTDDIYGDYSTIPMVYDPEIEQKKNASSSMLGLTAAGVIGLGVGMLAGRKWGGNGLKKAEASAEEAVKKYEAIVKENKVLETAKSEAEKSLIEYREAGWWTRLVRSFYPNFKLSAEEISAKKAAREAKKEVDNVAKKAEKTTQDAAKETEQTAKKD